MDKTTTKGLQRYHEEKHLNAKNCLPKLIQRESYIQLSKKIKNSKQIYKYTKTKIGFEISK